MNKKSFEKVEELKSVVKVTSFQSFLV